MALVAFAIAARAEAQSMQVIDLHHVTAAQAIPRLEPLLDPGEAITGMDDKLFVRAGPASLQRVEAALALLDVAPRELMITVAQGTLLAGDAAAVRGQATVGTVNSAQVVVLASGQRLRLANQSSVRAMP